jgi:hypothetical protein
MLELMLGILVLAIVIAAVLAFFELIDLFDLAGGVLRLIGEVVRLMAGLLFALAGFFVWLVRRQRPERKEP